MKNFLTLIGLTKKISANTKLMLNNAFEMQRYLTNYSNNNVIIFDVGAFDGSISLKYAGLFPSSLIYSFEPFPESFSKLVEKTSEYSNILPVNKGVGDFVGFAKFNSNKFSQTNSLLNSHKLANKVWGKNLLDKKKVINVELTTIDSFVEKHNIKKIDILKIDTQGSEYLVLKGAKESLKRGIVKLIYTEIIMLPTYENQLDFDEFIKLMKSFGFRLFNLYNLSLTKEGELRQVDALFLQQTSSKKVVI